MAWKTIGEVTRGKEQCTQLLTNQDQEMKGHSRSRRGGKVGESECPEKKIRRDI